MSKVGGPAPGSVWRHYKGHTYMVVGVARHSESLEWLVVYRRQDNSELWVRPLSMWSEQVKADVPRFTPVEPGMGEIEELRSENERLRSVIASLMPGDAGRVE